MSIPFPAVISAPTLATRFTDVDLISRYLDAGSLAGEPHYLGFGETWTEVPDGLTRKLASLPSYAHGYALSQYGSPRLQQTLRHYIVRTHGLSAVGELGRDYEMAAVHGGTRNTMSDFAGMIAAYCRDRNPVAITTAPGWDYANVVEPMGFRTRYLHLNETIGYQPSTAEFDRLVAEIHARSDEELALVIVNAQHNPTGANWEAETVRHIIRRALANNSAVLIDDAYYGVHPPDQQPTSALRIMLEEADPDNPRHRAWLAVRSLGKQFHCNGWGVGAATAHPSTLDTLVNRAMFGRSFASALPLQEAMASWLEDPESERYLESLRRDYAAKRSVVGRCLGVDANVQVGEFAPYARIRVRLGSATIDEFRAECLDKTGVLVAADRWTGPADTENAAPDGPSSYGWIRLFLGPPVDVILSALTRLTDAGYLPSAPGSPDNAR